MIIFLHPHADDATAIKEILSIFGEASGLRTNLTKCSITLIHVPNDNLPQLQEILGCQSTQFPITYLGLPLSTRKIPRARIQAAVDTINRRLPSSHGPLMARAADLFGSNPFSQRSPSTLLLQTGCHRGRSKKLTGSAAGSFGQERRDQ